MSQAAVTRGGLRGVRPGREATVGSAGGQQPEPSRAAAQPSASSYYGLPVLKRPTWSARDIAGYFFLGGLAGASSVLAFGADLTGRRRLARGLKLGAATALGGSLAGLIHDLGRPARFPMMLRVAKPTSPMSVGSWLLAGYGPSAVLAAGTAATGRLPRLGRLASVGAAALGPPVAAYTAALISDTAVPAWHDGYRELPFVFVSSAACAAGGLGLLTAPSAEAGPARRAAVAAAVAELGASALLERRLGDLVSRPYREGRSGRLLRASRVLTAAGALGAATLARRSRPAAMASGAALLAGSALTRFGIFQAGVASAEDPEYTVRPQRRRVDQRAQPQPQPLDEGR